MAKPLPPNCKEYVRDVRALSRFLSREEEQRLARLARDGDKAARDTLVASVLPLAIKLATWYWRNGRGGGMDLEDLIQLANMGVVRAVEKFDGDRGYRLTTYAHFWIRSHIRREVDCGGAHLIHKPQYVAALRPIASLFAVVDGTDELPLLSQLPSRDKGPIENAIRNEQMSSLLAAFESVPLRERGIIEDRIAGATLESIAHRLRLTKERVRQLETYGMSLICKALGLPDCGRSLQSLGFRHQKKC